MKKVQYVLMGIGLSASALSIIFSWGEGFHYVIWPIIATIWILNSLIIQKTLDKLEKQLDKHSAITSVSETKSGMGEKA
jgi:hypothetical protein